MFLQDAPQRAMNFLVNQAAFIEPVVYRTQYSEVQYPELVPIDTEGSPWMSSVTYFSLDGAGAADWFSGKALDIPHVDLSRDKFETTVSMAAIGYRYDLEELGKAMDLNINLNPERGVLARAVAEKFIDRVVLLGDANKGFTGVTNNPTVTAGTAAATGTGSATTFASKTPDMVLADINSVLTGVFTGTFGIETADTLLMPYTQLLDLNTRRIDAVNQTTILEWIERNNIVTRMTGRPILIRGVWGLETAGAGATARMVAYRRDPSVLKFHMPMPFRFLPVWQVGPILFEVPGIFRLGGVDVRRPKSMRYMDGI